MPPRSKQNVLLAAKSGVGRPSGHVRSRAQITRSAQPGAATLATRLPSITAARRAVIKLLALWAIPALAEHASG
jgi:hypothetical protein